MSGEYENMDRDELLVRLKDWITIASDRTTRILALQADLDVLRAAIKEFLHLNEQGQRAATEFVPKINNIDLGTEEGEAAAMELMALHGISELGSAAARAEANVRAILDGAEV